MKYNVALPPAILSRCAARSVIVLGSAVRSTAAYFRKACCPHLSCFLFAQRPDSFDTEDSTMSAACCCSVSEL